MAPRGPGRTDRALLGQQRSGSYQVTIAPGPRRLHVLPAGPGRRFVIKTRSRGQLSEGPGRGPAAERTKPRRTKLQITGETPEDPTPNPTYPILSKC
jgi:hypothetical protein